MRGAGRNDVDEGRKNHGNNRVQTVQELVVT